MSCRLLEEFQHPLIDVINHVDDSHVNQPEIFSLARKTFIRVSQPEVWIVEILEKSWTEVEKTQGHRDKNGAEMKNRFLLINCWFFLAELEGLLPTSLQANVLSQFR